MKQLSSSEIRQMFLDFFESKQHKVMPSASLVPVEDPTLLWINSGVATLKKYFDGTIEPDNPRMTNSQKSIRTNDIENVGLTARHHTFFEMLGNFSIGDYFKTEAIHWAWEFLTSKEWLALDPEKLYITIYPEDSEARRIWEEEIGVPVDHVVEEEGNFWQIGLGPCGPNTEIFYDRGQEMNNLPEDDPESYPGGENERWVEIWNLVFSQYNHLEDGSYEPLPNKNIDTGMGLERVVSIIQNAKTNFETDLFLPIIHQLEEITGVSYEDDDETQVSFKVIADHIRAVTFAIADGALPSNEGRGYVLRRLIRRAIMHAHKLGLDRPFLAELVPTIGEMMGDFYPNVVTQRDFIMQVLEREEVRFHETIAEGMDHLESIFELLKEQHEQMISGADAFLLYDTYGFPIELTEEYAHEQGFEVDLDAFKVEMEKQRERARNARSDEGSMQVQSDIFNQVTIESDFIGYDHLEAVSALTFIVEGGQFKQQVEKDINAQLIFEKTPFYAESGGQIGDTGIIFDQNECPVAEVLDVKKSPNGAPLHYVKVLRPLTVGQQYHLVVNHLARELTMRNHTATHLLHEALQEIVGKHATQAGSLVAPEHLRFDFTHFAPLTDEEIERIEQLVNEKIWENIPVIISEHSFAEAKKMGAMALFGEKYGDIVRVVQISDFSTELCGGTHVKSTGDIGIFKIVSETGIGAGTRRITAVTSQGALQWLEQQIGYLDQVKDTLHVKTRSEVPHRMEQLQNELKELKQENDSLFAKLANQELAGIFEAVEEVGAFTLIAAQVDAKEMEQLRQMSDEWKQKQASDVLVLAFANDGKVNLLVATNDHANEAGISANELIKAISKPIRGGGGGRAQLAQAGGKNPSGIADAFRLAQEYLKEKQSE
ncbi:alanine--tRNA ligase [Allofustis seminis]|uniref:alanine--tRNA ligase n=1 Tax=Allofustis seminis TaxID=166939 RepID=UPI0003628AF2|nr:alanine--tRNA ligase [Allofustis seminis]